MKKYFPILLSKAGEMKALENLSQNVKNGIVPTIQVLDSDFGRVKNFATEHWVFDGNQIMLDFSLTNQNLATISGLIQDLNASGVNVVFVVQSGGNQATIDLINDLFVSNVISSICIRFSNSNGGFLNIDANVDNLINALNIARGQVSLLLDFGYVESHNYNIIATSAVNILSNISHFNDFENIIIASGSFLQNLGVLSPAGRLYKLKRLEWDIWNIIIAQPNLRNKVKYSDYGVKYPYYEDLNFQGSCSIKYSTENEYVIYRGEISSNHPQGNGQYIIFSGQLIVGTDYSGVGFSWGDAKIHFFANQNINDPQRKTGNATSWVEISQNHHISLIHSIL